MGGAKRFVPKKDGGVRVTTDFRGLNNATVTDSYPMENVREVLDWLSSKSIFSTFDLKDGFFQVELAEDSKKQTAVRTVLGLLQYTRLPQGLKNSPGTFQRIVNAILGEKKRARRIRIHGRHQCWDTDRRGTPSVIVDSTGYA